MLMRRGWSTVNRCSLCKENKESADHILIHCGKTRELWTLLLSSFGGGVGVPSFSEKSASRMEN